MNHLFRVGLPTPSRFNRAFSPSRAFKRFAPLTSRFLQLQNDCRDTLSRCIGSGGAAQLSTSIWTAWRGDPQWLNSSAISSAWRRITSSDISRALA